MRYKLLQFAVSRYPSSVPAHGLCKRSCAPMAVDADKIANPGRGALWHSHPDAPQWLPST